MCTTLPKKARGIRTAALCCPLTPDGACKRCGTANLRPPLYYTQQEQTPCANGVWESPHTVASKLESKEEFPQG